MLGASLGNSFGNYLFFDTCRQLCQKMNLEVSSFATFVPEEIAQ